MGNVNMEASQINYRGGEKKMSVEEALKNTSGEAAAIAQLQTDVLNLNSNKANQITIAPFFNAEASYDPGDLVYYNGLSYRCVNAHEGEWDADDFAATTISNELDALKSGLTNLTKYSNLASGASVNITGSACVLFAFRADSITSNTVNAVVFCTSGTLLYLVNSGGNTSPLSASYSNGITTVTNNNSVAVNFGYVVLTN